MRLAKRDKTARRKVLRRRTMALQATVVCMAWLATSFHVLECDAQIVDPAAQQATYQSHEEALPIPAQPLGERTGRPDELRPPTMQPGQDADVPSMDPSNQAPARPPLAIPALSDGALSPVFPDLPHSTERESIPVQGALESASARLPISGSPIPPGSPQDVATSDAQPTADLLRGIGLEQFVQPERIESSLKTVALLSIVSLAPAILLMTTSFVRISIVLGLLRQAMGTQMLPSNQIVTSLAMFLSLLVMAPVWKQVYESAIVPYTSQESTMTAVEAWEIGVAPVRAFMIQQIEIAENSDEVLMFYEHLPDYQQPPETYDDVPLQVLLPAFMLSELKTAFLIGFQIYLPFLIVDLVVSSVTVSMGMMMLPPVMVSMPLKLLLFVMVDGWQLVVGMLLQSFSGYG